MHSIGKDGATERKNGGDKRVEPHRVPPTKQPSKKKTVTPEHTPSSLTEEERKDPRKAIKRIQRLEYEEQRVRRNLLQMEKNTEHRLQALLDVFPESDFCASLQEHKDPYASNSTTNANTSSNSSLSTTTTTTNTTTGQQHRTRFHHQQPTALNALNLKALLEHMKDPHFGIELDDHRYHFRKYHSCFIGKDMVDWLIRNGWAKTRTQGLGIGNSLIAAGFITHVKKEHDFKDEELFYRFQDINPFQYVNNPQHVPWGFTQLVSSYSIGITAKLAHQIESCHEDLERWKRIKQLRRHLRFLVVDSAQQEKAWGFVHSRNDVDTYVMDRVFGTTDSKLGLPRAYQTKAYKCVGTTRVPARRFVKEFLNFRTRPRWDPLFARAKVLCSVGGCPNARIMYRTTISPIRSLWPMDVCVFQDHFTYTVGRSERVHHCVYEISVEHKAAPLVPGHTRTQVLLSARFLTDDPRGLGTTLVHVSQVEMKKDAPQWFVEKWMGLPSVENYGKVPAYHRDFKGVLYDREIGEAESRAHADVGLTDFEPLAVLGRGAHSKIMQVKHIEKQRLFAMKVIRKTDIIKTRQVANIMRERNILSTLRHPHLVRLHYSFQTADKLYLVMDYAGGGDLFTFLQRNGPFTDEMGKQYAAQMVCALRYLHASGIAHRDLKPENIFFTEEGHLLVGDLGLSKDKLKGPEDRTYTLVGTAEYMAPELLKGNPHSMQVDWWQFGIVLHEMLTGTHPFFAENTRIMHNRIVHEPPEINTVVLSEQAQELIARLLAKDPGDRLGRDVENKDIETHPYFNDIDWKLIEENKTDPMFKPEVLFPGDVRNFDKGFTRELPIERAPQPQPVMDSHTTQRQVGRSSSSRNDNNNVIRSSKDNSNGAPHNRAVAHLKPPDDGNDRKQGLERSSSPPARSEQQFHGFNFVSHSPLEDTGSVLLQGH